MAENRKAYKIVLLLVSLALLVSTAFSQRYLNQQRDTLGLTRVTVLENAPPVLAFTTVALGGFRGLIANALWIRASELQDDGKYFEMVQLSNWITKLQPNIAMVWVHLAWNMAYNISIKFNDPEDRWTWVRNGIVLLRDEGLKYNPNEPLIYRELGWFFQHKIGYFLDDAHAAFKHYWALEMAAVLGKSRPDWTELVNPSTPEAQERVRILRETYKMDPAFMQTIDKEYGPLEWYLPEAHAIYWASLGLVRTSKENLKKEDFITLRRVIFHSLQLSFHRGRLIYPTKSSTNYVYGPNLDIIRQASDAYEEMAMLEPDKRDNILNGHKNFVRTAVYFLYVHNKKAAATQWFNFLKRYYPQAVPEGMNMDDYAFMRIAEDAGETDPHRVTAIIEGIFETAFVNYSIGEDDAAINHELWAVKLWNRYMQAIGKGTEKRVGLRPLAEIRQEVLDRMLDPEAGMDPILELQLRSRLGLGPRTNAPPAEITSPALPGAATNSPAPSP